VIYNNVPTHARPIAQNIISNSMLKYFDKENKSENLIKVTNHPLPESRVVGHKLSFSLKMSQLRL
jgi:hypothetical protein